MTDSPSIVPSETELRQWESLILDEEENVDVVLLRVFQAGADQELEACCVAIKNLKWFVDPSLRIAELRAARRPKPLSLKEQALKELDWVDKNLLWRNVSFFGHCDSIQTIRRALKALPDN